MQTLKTIGIAAIVSVLGLSGTLAQQAATAPANISGAFDTLPPGNKSIAESLYSAQTGPTYWTRDQIATAKMSGDGWGEIFHEMKRDGLISDKSLGQVIRRDANPPAAIHRQRGNFSRRELTVTTASGVTRVVSPGNGHFTRNSGAALTTGTNSHGASSASSTLGGGLAANKPGGQGGEHGNGAAMGHGH